MPLDILHVFIQEGVSALEHDLVRNNKVYLWVKENIRFSIWVNTKGSIFSLSAVH
jgi:hypothetical protein